MTRKTPTSETQLIDALRPYCHFTPSRRFPLEIGDDAMVRRCTAGERLVITGDSVVEEVDFSLQWMSLAQVGAKVMTANVSDCAAMGAVPDSAVCQVVFPRSCRQLSGAMKALYRGMHDACRHHDFPIIGGDLSAGPCWMIAVTMLGRMSGKAAVLTRNGARPGDLLWVTGTPGCSAAGLALLRSGIRKPRTILRYLVNAHVAPQARVEAGRALAAHRNVHGAIDVSDGISKESALLAQRAGLQLELDLERLFTPHPALVLYARQCGCDWREWVLHGGEDYELLFSAHPAFDPRHLELSLPLHCIGRFTRPGRGVRVRGADGRLRSLEHKAFDHCATA